MEDGGSAIVGKVTERASVIGSDKSLASAARAARASRAHDPADAR